VGLACPARHRRGTGHRDGTELDVDTGPARCMILLPLFPQCAGCQMCLAHFCAPCPLMASAACGCRYPTARARDAFGFMTTHATPRPSPGGPCKLTHATHSGRMCAAIKASRRSRFRPVAGKLQQRSALRHDASACVGKAARKARVMSSRAARSPPYQATSRRPVASTTVIPQGLTVEGRPTTCPIPALR